MAADDHGPKGEPIYSASGASDDAADLTEVAAYAAEVGNRKVATSAVRAALSGDDVWPGLLFYETDTGLTWIYVAGTGWTPVNGAAPIFTEDPEPALLVAANQTRTIGSTTVQSADPRTVWIVLTLAIQGGSADTNWAGWVWITVNGQRIGARLRTGNISAPGKTPLPYTRIVKANLPKGSSVVNAVASIDQFSGTGAYSNNLQLEVWPA